MDILNYLVKIFEFTLFSLCTMCMAGASELGVFFIVSISCFYQRFR